MSKHGKSKKHERYKRKHLQNNTSKSSSLPPPPDKFTLTRSKSSLNAMDTHTRTVVAEAKTTFSKYKESFGDIKSGLYAMSPLDKSRLPVLVVCSTCRMAPENLKKILKWTPSRKELNAFHIRNPEAFGLGETSFEVRLDHIDGEIIAIKIKNAFSMEESLQLLQLRECHHQVSVGWNKGCEADPLPTTKLIRDQIKDEKCMKSSGFRSTNVQKVIHLGPTTKSGCGCKYGYLNTTMNRTIYRSISTHIDRHKWAKTGSKSPSNLISKSESLSIVDIAMKLYIDLIPKYLLSRKFDCEDVQDCLSEINDNLQLSMLTVTKAKPIAIHRDPLTPTFALLFGDTTHKLQGNKWVDPRLGGTLFFMDGLLELKYSPRDIMIIDGNIAHGVTNVIDSGSKDVTERFSGIIFCKWRREKLKRPGKYSGINV